MEHTKSARGVVVSLAALLMLAFTSMPVYGQSEAVSISTGPLPRKISYNAPGDITVKTPGIRLLGETAPVSRMPRSSKSSKLAVKTNLLYAGAALTPNLGLEIGTGYRTTFNIFGSYNPWGPQTPGSEKKLEHWMVQPEFRYWLRERFNGHFFGIQAFYGDYDVSGYGVPLYFEKDLRYDGFMTGAGVTYGYHLMLAPRWGLEFTVGAGYVYMEYDKYGSSMGADSGNRYSKSLFGLTKAGINLIFIIK